MVAIKRKVQGEALFLLYLHMNLHVKRSLLLLISFLPAIDF